MTPFILGFAFVALVLAIGLRYRTIWMWYLGWIMFYLFAAYFGNLFFAALYDSMSYGALGYSIIYLIGGLVLWLPAIVWWSRNKNLFKSKNEPNKPT